MPTIQCAGCQQGFHQECLDEMFGEADLSQFPGRLHWLCTECAPKFSLMTSVGVDGRTEKPRSKRVVREPVTEAPPVHQGPEAGDTDDDASNSADTVAAPPAPPVEPSAAGPPLPDCPLLVRGGCPHGMSGKKDGVCKYLHRARCSTYMKWGDKVDKGCKKVPCDKLHPLVCPRSLDLKSLEKNCDVKHHA